MSADQKTFAEEFERVLVESDTSVRRLARLTGISRRTLENWLYRYSTGPRYVEPILHVVRALQLTAVDADRLLLSAGHPTLTRLRQKKQLQPDILLEWQLPPDTQKGQKHAALGHTQQLLQQMPWNEEIHREVMELLALNGRRSEALNQFKLCKKALWDKLNVQPSAETLALYERIKRTTHFSRDNIPAIVTPLIGREEELQALSSLLANPDVRLVTISGLGGIGKTRLALDIAWQQTKGQFRDGVTFVQLAALKSAGLLVPAIAQALHLPLQAADEQAARIELLDYLKPKQLLLVLDNCEHLLDGMTLAAELLVAAPQVQILTTSRERVRLRAEYVFPLSGLPYDDRRLHPAAQLFQATAQRIMPHFEISELNNAHVNQLCRLVDGIPLALELAAGTLDRTSVASLATEIEHSLDTLISDFHDMPARHRSLRAVLESTWKRLQPQTRQIFAALSTFRGSFAPDAAWEVAGASPELLKQLMAHSLLEFDREADRCLLHEMLRQFAADKLAATPELEHAAGQRHFTYYSDLGQRGGEAMRGGDQVTWMARLEIEEGNIRQAIDWAAECDIEATANLAISLHTFWNLTGRFQEAVQQYERILPYQEQLSSQLIPWLLVVYAQALSSLGNIEKGVALETRALPLFLEQGDEEGASFIYLLWSYKARGIGQDINISIQLAEAGLQHALAPGTDSYYASLLLDSLSIALAHSGRIQESGEAMSQGYHLCIKRDDMITATYLMAPKVMQAVALGRQVEAHHIAEEYLDVSRQLGLLSEELIALDFLKNFAFEVGDLDQAEDYTTTAIELAREANYQFHLSSLVLGMGDILMAKDANREALPYFREALFRYQKKGSLNGPAQSVERLAHWIWRNKKSDLVPVRWIACAVNWLENTGEITSNEDNIRRAMIRTELETHLGKEELDRIWVEGEGMDLEKVLEELLPELPQESAEDVQRLPY